jgi:hypothetical protein
MNGRKERFIANIRFFEAQVAIGPSTLRGQGARGVVRAARSFLYRDLDLRRLVRDSRAGFLRQLDRATDELQRSFPRGARHWGSARKALNIYLRFALYNRYLSRHYGLARLEPFLEVPLDRQTATAARAEPEGCFLPRWRGVKYLTPEGSQEYQEAVRRIARRKKVAPVHLDAYWWRGASR